MVKTELRSFLEISSLNFIVAGATIINVRSTINFILAETTSDNQRPFEHRNPPSERRGANNSSELGAFGTSRFSDRRIPPSAVSNFLFFRSRNGTGESKKKESDSRDRNGVGNISETRPMDVPIFWLRKISRRVSGNLLATTRKKSRAARFHRVSQKLIDHLSLCLSVSLSLTLPVSDRVFDTPRFCRGSCATGHRGRLITVTLVTSWNRSFSRDTRGKSNFSDTSCGGQLEARRDV